MNEALAERSEELGAKNAELERFAYTVSHIGQIVNPPEDVGLEELAREAIELVIAPAAATRVEVDIHPDLPILYGDRSRLREVLQNLVENAVKWTADQKQPHIEIGARQDEGETVCFVRDNGVGIAPQFHEKIFGLFDKLDAKSEGTGVGLAVVKRIIEVHGGRIWVESEGAGYGSTFCFTVAAKA